MKKKHKLCTLLEFRGSDLSVKTVKAVESKIKGMIFVNLILRNVNAMRREQ